MLQCGDPSGDGKGGPGYRFANEYRPTSTRRVIRRCRRKCSTRGTLAMANAMEPNGSQFFLVTGFQVAAELHGVRDHRRHRSGHPGQDRRGQGRQGAFRDNKPATEVKIKSIRLD